MANADVLLYFLPILHMLLLFSDASELQSWRYCPLDDPRERDMNLQST